MKFNFVFILTFIVVSCCSAQTSVKITKISDTNLFQLEDGRYVKMAGLDVPVKDSPGKYLGKLIDNILSYEKAQLLGHKLEMQLADSVYSDSAVSLVYIQKAYDLGAVTYNKRFLELGYGKFLDNVDSLHRDEYRKAEAEAIEDRTGLWSYRLPEVRDTLDRKYSLSETAYYNGLDSLYNIKYLRENSPHIAWQITGQTFSGALGGFLGSISLGLVSGLAFNQGGEYGGLGAALMGMTAGYVVGAPLGVYIVAKSTNPALTYGNTLLFSTLSTLGGIGIALLGPQDHNNPLWVIPALMPMISSLVYVNWIAPNPVRNNLSYQIQDISQYGGLAYKDYYNSSIQFRLNILSLSF